MSSFQDDLDDLESAEDFLRYFGIPYDPRVVHVNRLHILQRLRDYLDKEDGLDALAEDARRARYKALLELAYGDFVTSNAITEKVFKVHKEQAKAQEGRFVSLDSLTVRGFTVTDSGKAG
ncbi:MAG TPA: nitrogenase-stabilizing/protective protein NifW [Azospirillaceae bacterium]|nr:nitrogenase-stabilizing/protective protein NifW [Azospirillaceae bacterium]